MKLLEKIKLAKIISNLKNLPKEKKRILLSAVIALILASFLSSKNEEKSLAEQVLANRVQIIVLKKDMEARSVLTENSFSYAAILASNVTKNMLKKGDGSLVIGRETIVDLKAGDPLLATAIDGGAGTGRLSSKIPKGKRLFTLTVTDVTGRYGFLKPHDHVDLIAHMKLPGRGDTSFTILSNIRVISVGETDILDDSDEVSGSSVSFFVDTKTAEMLSFAQKKGSFSISLRNPRDISVAESTHGVDIDDFLNFKSIVKASGGTDLKIITKGEGDAEE